LFTSPLTLVFLQDVSLALAAIVIYFIGKNIVNNKYFGFALSFAFLINPGVVGIASSDTHVEAFIPLFYLLCFYFYMKGNRKYFTASYILMLSTIEFSVVVGASLMIGMAVYGFFYSRSKEDTPARTYRLSMIKIALLITFIFAVFYLYVISTLLSMYQAGYYSNLPPYDKVINFVGIYWSLISQPSMVQYNASLFLLSFVFSFAALFLGFSITSLRNIFITLILMLPWVLVFVLLHNLAFAAFDTHYYAYSIGGAAVAAILGFMIISRQKGKISRKIVSIIPSFTITLSVILSLLLLGVGLPNPTVLIPSSWQSIQNYSSIQIALQSIPPNSSVMAQPSIAPHLEDILNLEFPPDYMINGFQQQGFGPLNISLFYYAKPEYIVFDPQLPDYDSYMNSAAFNIYSYMGDNYTLYKSVSGVEIYKLSNN
jgi:uncharacterized membrane protein